jgi:hypothetical protein
VLTGLARTVHGENRTPENLIGTLIPAHDTGDTDVGIEIEPAAVYLAGLSQRFGECVGERDSTLIVGDITDDERESRLAGAKQGV